VSAKLVVNRAAMKLRGAEIRALVGRLAGACPTVGLMGT
jgi:hypothetical protein